MSLGSPILRVSPGTAVLTLTLLLTGPAGRDVGTAIGKALTPQEFDIPASR